MEVPGFFTPEGESVKGGKTEGLVTPGLHHPGGSVCTGPADHLDNRCESRQRPKRVGGSLAGYTERALRAAKSSWSAVSDWNADTGALTELQTVSTLDK